MGASLKLVFLIAVFISSVEITVSTSLEGDGDNQKFTEDHFTYSDMSHG